MSSKKGAAFGTCLTCGTHLTGIYCSTCGEKRVDSHDLQLSHLSHDFWHEFTHLDGKIWGTFSTLLFKPGQLTKDYWEGRRGLWMRPLRIFLIVSALSLLLAPDAAGPLGMKIFAREGANGPELSVGTRPSAMAKSKGIQVGTETRGMDVTFGLEKPIVGEQLALLNGKIQKVYKVIQYISLAIFAAVSLLLSRKIQPYYGAHLILALHYYSVEYILTGLVSVLKLNPGISLSVGFLYLAIALWKLIGSGRTEANAVGTNWSSLWRTGVLFSVVGFSELLVMATASRIALMMH